MTVGLEAAFHMVILKHLKFISARSNTQISGDTCNYFKISLNYDSTDKRTFQAVLKSLIIKDEHNLIKYLYKLLTEYLEIHCTMDTSEYFFPSILEARVLQEL